MEENNIAIRLKFLMSHFGLNNTEFADKTGISRATLSQLLTGRNQKVSDVIIGKVHNEYPEVSVLWLLFGEGEPWNVASQDTGEVKTGFAEQGDGLSSQSSAGTRESADDDDMNWMIDEPSVGKFSGRGQAGFTEGKENRDIHYQNRLNELETQLDNERKITIDLQTQINNLTSKIKKISQITVYYDDSTFESFFPANRS